MTHLNWFFLVIKQQLEQPVYFDSLSHSFFFFLVRDLLKNHSKSHQTIKSLWMWMRIRKFVLILGPIGSTVCCEVILLDYNSDPALDLDLKTQFWMNYSSKAAVYFSRMIQNKWLSLKCGSNYVATGLPLANGGTVQIKVLTNVWTEMSVFKIPDPPLSRSLRALQACHNLNKQVRKVSLVICLYAVNAWTYYL